MAKTFKTSTPPTRKPRNSWPESMVRDATPRTTEDRIMSRIERKANHASQKHNRVSRMRYTLIARTTAAIKSGALIGTTVEAARDDILSWSDAQVANVYRQITAPTRTQRPATKNRGSVQNQRRNIPYTMADGLAK